MTQRRRSRERGAAMVEAAVAIGLFVAIWACLTFVFELTTRKHAAQIEARDAAWAWALNSCEDGAFSRGGSRVEADDPDALDQVHADSSVPSGTEPLPQEGDVLLDQAANSGQGLELGEHWGVARASASRSEVSGPAFLPLTAMTPSSTVEVLCDEKPRGANPRDVLSFLWGTRDMLWGN